ncbi:MAG: hypothetical protein R3250_15265, partial [Melioribacteraceae bacterium]|nr:hypothetical protein [Melioribacteraceae bacterium]
LDPLYVYNYSNLGELYTYKGDLQTAFTLFQQADLLVGSSDAKHHQVYIDLFDRKYEAVEQALIEIQVDEAYKLYYQCYMHLLKNDQAKFESSMAEYSSKYGDSECYFIASMYAYVNQADQAFEWLEKAYQLKNPKIKWLKLDFQFKNLHSDPRWVPLLKKLKFPEPLLN